MLIAVVTAIASGACFAGAGVLQQRAASTRPESEALSFRLIVHLARDRLWLVGIALALLSYVLEAIALSFGPLVLVQPLVVSELLFALPISVRWRGKRMSKRDWLGTGAVALGLAVGLVSAAPGRGQPNAPITDWAIALGMAAVLTIAALAVGGRLHGRGPLRSSFYSVAAALALGSQAALLKATIARFELGAVQGFESWEPYAMTAAAISGLLLVQSAYESGPLASTMPVVDAVESSVGILFGAALFHEHIRSGTWVTGIVAGLLLLFSGIWLLDTSPLVQSLHKMQRQEHQRSTGRDEARVRSDPPAGPTPSRTSHTFRT